MSCLSFLFILPFFFNFVFFALYICLFFVSSLYLLSFLSSVPPMPFLFSFLSVFSFSSFLLLSSPTHLHSAFSYFLVFYVFWLSRCTSFYYSLFHYFSCLTWLIFQFCLLMFSHIFCPYLFLFSVISVYCLLYLLFLSSLPSLSFLSSSSAIFSGFYLFFFFLFSMCSLSALYFSLCIFFLFPLSSAIFVVREIAYHNSLKHLALNPSTKLSLVIGTLWFAWQSTLEGWISVMLKLWYVVHTATSRTRWRAHFGQAVGTKSFQHFL